MRALFEPFRGGHAKRVRSAADLRTRCCRPALSSPTSTAVAPDSSRRCCAIPKRSGTTCSMKSSALHAPAEKYGVVFTGTLEEYDLEVDVAATTGIARRNERGESGAGSVRTRPMSYRVGIDIGGTFTDFALLNGAEVMLYKNLSTPEDRSIGVMSGLGRLAEMRIAVAGRFPRPVRCHRARHHHRRQHPDRNERRGDRPDHHGRLSR